MLFYSVALLLAGLLSAGPQRVLILVTNVRLVSCVPVITTIANCDSDNSELLGVLNVK